MLRQTPSEPNAGLVPRIRHVMVDTPHRVDPRILALWVDAVWRRQRQPLLPEDR
jgi:hypothetical protein